MKTILVLGATGMVGLEVFKYLKKNASINVFGTSKNHKDYFLLHVNSVNEDIAKIYKKLKKIDYVINCIGELRDFKNIEDLINTNSLFPHILEILAIKYKFSLIHISSDAVFSHNQNSVSETDLPNPQDLYGASKWLGETKSIHALTIRTSFLGNGGLLKWINTYKEKTIPGFINQKWNGCTTLQFAMFCEDIICNERFPILRKLSPVFHFAPIKPTSKYEIIKSYIQIKKLNKGVVKQKGKTIKRVLSTIHFDILKLNNYTNIIHSALKELIKESS